MSKYLYTLVLFSATVVGFASPAFAGDIAIKTEMKPTMVEESSATEMPEARIIATRTEAESDVRSAVERGEFVPVEGPDGRIYYNQIIQVSDLPDPELNLRVVEKFELNHNGMVFTNKIVQEAK